jgi:large subunit ribosomal protein L15
MQVNELKTKNSNKNRKRVGRGGKKGTYSGKGGKGQTARSGRKLVPIIRELIKRYPKLKGYRQFEMEDFSAVINLDRLEKHTKEGDVITPAYLVQKGLVRQIKGKVPAVKVLGKGELTKKLIIEHCTVSATAKAAIEKAGGVIK